MKHSGLEEQRLAVDTWHFLSGFVLPAHNVPPCGERLRPTNHWPSMTGFDSAKETVFTNSFLLPNFSLLSPFLAVWCSVYFAWISPVGCEEDEGKQQAVRLLKR